MSGPVNLKNGKQSDNGLDESFSLKKVQMCPSGGAHPDQGVNRSSDSSKNILEEVELEILLEEDLSGSRVAEFEGIDTKQNVETSSELEDKAIHLSQATGRPWQGNGRTNTASHLNPGKVTEGKINQPKLDSMEIMLLVKKRENLTRLQQKVAMMRPTTSTANWFGFKLKPAALGICIVLQAYTVFGTERTETKQRTVQLGGTERLPSRTCSDDNIWNFSYQNKSEIPICEGLKCADDYKMEKDKHNSCHLVFNVTKEKLGIYRNTLYHNDFVSDFFMCIQVSRLFIFTAWVNMLLLEKLESLGG